MNLNEYQDDPRLRDCILFAPYVFEGNLLASRNVDIIGVNWMNREDIKEIEKGAKKPIYDLIVNTGHPQISLLSFLYAQKEDMMTPDRLISQFDTFDFDKSSADYMQYTILGIDIAKNEKLFKVALATIKTPLTNLIFRHLYGKG